jgi:hypothetical protein
MQNAARLNRNALSDVYYCSAYYKAVPEGDEKVWVKFQWLDAPNVGWEPESKKEIINSLKFGGQSDHWTGEQELRKHFLV